MPLAEQLGYELYAVGGCIRDPLLGRAVGDIDLAVVGDAVTLAQQIARHEQAGQVAIYSRFGTALVAMGDRRYEFATARAESYNHHSRKPATVTPVSIEVDLRRRDFTINALALGVAGARRGEFLDLFEGLGDLRRGLIRTPLDPDRTFSDDPLRMLRAVRFAAQFGFEIEAITLEGIRANVSRLQIVAQERIGDELWRMLSGADAVRAMEQLIEVGLMKSIMPEVVAMGGVEQIGRHHHKDVLRHSLKVMAHVAEQTDDPVLRLAGLLHDVGKPRTKRFDAQSGWTFHGHEIVGARMTYNIGRRLRIGRENLERLTRLVRLHMRPVNLTDEGVTDSAVRRLMVEAGDQLEEQLILCRADITTANPKLVHRYLNNFAEMERRMKDVEARDRMRQFQSPIRGEEIMSLCGIEPGPAVGVLKGRIEDAILDGIIPYDAESARDYLFQIKDEVLNCDKLLLLKEQKERARLRHNVTADFSFPDHRETQ